MNEPVEIVSNGTSRGGGLSRWTDERIERIASLLRVGVSREGAVKAVGLSLGELYKRMATNRRLREAIDHAELECEKHLVGLVMEHSKKDGKVALSVLARKFEAWRPKETGQVQHLHAHAQVSGQFLESFSKSRQTRDLELRQLPSELSAGVQPEAINEENQTDCDVDETDETDGPVQSTDQTCPLIASESTETNVLFQGGPSCHTPTPVPPIAHALSTNPPLKMDLGSKSSSPFLEAPSSDSSPPVESIVPLGPALPPLANPSHLRVQSSFGYDDDEDEPVEEEDLPTLPVQEPDPGDLKP
jgi:hypothetical protein